MLLPIKPLSDCNYRVLAVSRIMLEIAGFSSVSARFSPVFLRLCMSASQQMRRGEGHHIQSSKYRLTMSNKSFKSVCMSVRDVRQQQQNPEIILF